MRTPLLSLLPLTFLPLPLQTLSLSLPPPIPPTHHPITKRSPSRPQTACPPHHTFIESRCRPSTPQSYYTLCYDHILPANIFHQPVNHPWLFTDAECAPSEICIDGRAAEPPTAWCVSMDNFVRIAQTARVEVPWYEQARYRYPPPREREVQALLTGMGGRASVVAERMAMVGRSDVPARDRADAGTVGAGQECRNCTGLRLRGVPDGVMTVEVDVELGTGMGVGSGRGGVLLWVLVGGVLS